MLVRLESRPDRSRALSHAEVESKACTTKRTSRTPGRRTPGPMATALAAVAIVIAAGTRSVLAEGRRHDRDDQHHGAHRGECRGGTVIRTQTSPGPARRGLARLGLPAGRAVVCGLPAVSSGGSSTMTSSAAAVGFSSYRPADSTDTSGTASPSPAWPVGAAAAGRSGGLSGPPTRSLVRGPLCQVDSLIALRPTALPQRPGIEALSSIAGGFSAGPPQCPSGRETTRSSAR